MPFKTGVEVAKNIQGTIETEESLKKKKKKKDKANEKEKVPLNKEIKKAMSKAADKSAKQWLADLMNDPEGMEVLSVEGARIHQDKSRGPFPGVPFTIMERAKANDLRTLQQGNIDYLKENIGNNRWFQGSPMVGSISEEYFNEFLKWYQDPDRDPEDPIPEYLEGAVTTLDGQHRIEVLNQMAEKTKTKEEKRKILANKITVTLYVDLDREERRIISLYTQKVMTTLMKITLVDLLRQMRDAWLSMMRSDMIDPQEADKALIVTYSHQLATMLSNTTMGQALKVAKDTAKHKEVRGKKQEAGRKRYVAKAMINWGESLYKKVRWAFQVPILNHNQWYVWPLWYCHLKNMEANGKATEYNADHYLELGGMSSLERFSVMCYAAVESLKGPQFKQLCKFVKGHRTVILEYSKHIHPLVKNALETAPAERKEVIKAKANEWLEWLQGTRYPAVLSLSANKGKLPSDELASVSRNMLGAIVEDLAINATDIIERLAPLLYLTIDVDQTDFTAAQFVDQTAQAVHEHWCEDVYDMGKIQTKVRMTLLNLIFP